MVLVNSCFVERVIAMFNPLHLLSPVYHNVQKWAKRLDQKTPDWYNRIDIETIDMHSSSRCILGQIYTATANKNALQYSGYIYGLDIVLNADYNREVTIAFHTCRAKKYWVYAIKQRHKNDQKYRKLNHQINWEQPEKIVQQEEVLV